MAALALGELHHLDLGGGAEHRLIELEPELVAQVRPAKHLRATAPACAAENVAEYVAEDVAESVPGAEAAAAAPTAALSKGRAERKRRVPFRKKSRPLKTCGPEWTVSVTFDLASNTR